MTPYEDTAVNALAHLIGDAEDGGAPTPGAVAWFLVQNKQALLAALDAVPREREEVAKDMFARRACEAEDRAERAERERDALRADAARYRELCREWRAACSADADADAEPGYAEGGEQHPEDHCHRCGAPNPSWVVDSDRFNAAMGNPGSHLWQGIVCVGCFVRLHEAATGLTCTWKLVPETPFRHADAKAETFPRCPGCHRAVFGWLRWGARTGEACEDCDEPEPSRTHSRSGQPIKRANVADGGVMGDIVPCHECGGTGELHDPHELPEDAEPQDTPTNVGSGSESPTGDDESLDDDGRSRAIKAALARLRDSDGMAGTRAEAMHAATLAIDAALGEGGVVRVEHLRRWLRRVHELETALRPFAEFLDALDVQGGYDPPDGWLVRIGSDPPVTLPIEAFHRARAALGEAAPPWPTSAMRDGL